MLANLTYFDSFFPPELCLIEASPYLCLYSICNTQLPLSAAF